MVFYPRWKDMTRLFLVMVVGHSNEGFFIFARLLLVWAFHMPTNRKKIVRPIYRTLRSNKNTLC